MAYDIGPRIGIEGESEFKKALKLVNEEIRTLGSEMKVVTSEFGGIEDSLESYAAKTDVLVKQIGKQEEKVELLTRQLDKAKEAYGENDTRVLKLKQQLNNATAELNTMQSELRQTENRMDDFGKEVDDTADDIQGAEKSWLSFADVVNANIIADFAAEGIRELGGAMKSLVADSITAAADMKAQQSQFEQTFGDLRDEAKVTVAEIGKEAGIANSRLNGVATSIYGFAMASGATTEEAMQLMEQSLMVAADGAAYYDRTLEDTTETLQSFLKGNFENDAALGLSATETTRNAKAMELFGMEFKKLSEIQKQQTLLQMVADAQELSGAVGQAQRESKSLTNLAENIKSNWNLILADLGEPIVEGIIPVLDKLSDGLYFLFSDAGDEELIEFFNELGGAVVNFFETLRGSWVVDRLGQIAESWTKVIFQGIQQAIPMLNATAFNIVHSLSEFLKENLPEIIATGLEMVSALAASARENVGMIVNAAVELAKSLAKGLADSIPIIIEKAPIIISNLANTINDNAPKIFAAAIEIIATLAKGLIAAIPTLLANMPAIIGAIWDTLTAVSWWTLGSNIITGLGNGIKSMVDFAASGAASVKDAILGGLKELPSAMLEVGKNLVRGIADGVKAMMSWLKSQIKEFAVGVVDSVKGFFDINSPSKVMEDEVGKNLALGIGEGFTGDLNTVNLNMQRQLGKVLEETKRSVAEVSQEMQTLDMLSASTMSKLGSFNQQTVSTTASAKEMAMAMREALEGAGVYMEGKKVGKLITTQQNNNTRARGISPAYG